jgi:hypothetical protein
LNLKYFISKPTLSIESLSQENLQEEEEQQPRVQTAIR